METTTTESIIEQLRKVLKDGIDYLGSVLKLQQVRLTSLTLSAAVFVALLFFAGLLGLAAFVLVNVALGMWLSQLLGNPLYSVLILGAVYALLAWLTIRKALAWLNRIRS
jgi:uncharacterized protein (DUF2062 family)